MKVGLVIRMKIDYDRNYRSPISFAMKMVKLIFGGKLSALYPMLRRDLDISMEGVYGGPPSVGKVLPVHTGGEMGEYFGHVRHNIKRDTCTLLSIF